MRYTINIPPDIQMFKRKCRERMMKYCISIPPDMQMCEGLLYVDGGWGKGVLDVVWCFLFSPIIHVHKAQPWSGCLHMSTLHTMEGGAVGRGEVPRMCVWEGG